MKYIEYCKIFCTSIFTIREHLAKRVPRILVIQQTTQHWTQVAKIMNFTANVVAKFVFLPAMGRSQHACYWLDSCYLQELLYCLMLWTILFYSFLFSWEFRSGLWLANLSVTSSIQSMHMQVILNVYQSAQWWLFTESNQIIIICSVSFISTCHVIDENNSVVPYCNCSKFCSTTCTVECLKNVFKCINFESVIAYLYFLD